MCSVLVRRSRNGAPIRERLGLAGVQGAQMDDEFPMLGALSPSDAAIKLRQLGEDHLANLLETGGPATRTAMSAIRGGLIWPFQDRPWQYTAHAFGYLPLATLGSEENASIRFAGNIASDSSLVGQQIKITLNQLRVADYPGGSEHQILFEFSARNQVDDARNEDAHFNIYLRAREGQSAAVIGIPIFVGLNVGSEGVALHCQTVNVKNSDDERFLEFMESDLFQRGLQLMKTVQPAIAPLAQMTAGITKSLLKRNRNVKVQEFHLGLDFSQVPTGARLAEGAYVVVQIPDTLAEDWDWADWVYKPTTGNIVMRDDLQTRIPFNYVVFGVSRIGRP
jgi:hypothetical protein